MNIIEKLLQKFTNQKNIKIEVEALILALNNISTKEELIKTIELCLYFIHSKYYNCNINTKKYIINQIAEVITNFQEEISFDTFIETVPNSNTTIRVIFDNARPTTEIKRTKRKEEHEISYVISYALTNEEKELMQIVHHVGADKELKIDANLNTTAEMLEKRLIIAYKKRKKEKTLKK